MNLSTGGILKVGRGLDVSKAISIGSPVLAIVISLLIVGLVVWPKFSEVLRLRTANKELEVRATALEEKSSQLSNLDRVAYEGYLASAESILPSDKAIFLLIGQVEQAAQTSGVILSRLDVAPGTLSDGDVAPATERKTEAGGGAEGEEVTTPKIGVKLSVGSDYKSMLSFFNNLLSSPRAVSIEDLTISVTAAEASQIKASFTLNAYWQDLPHDLPPIEQPITLLTDSEIKILSKVAQAGLSGEPSAPSVPSVPQVPIGRPDLFTPF